MLSFFIFSRRGNNKKINQIRERSRKNSNKSAHLHNQSPKSSKNIIKRKKRVPQLTCKYAASLSVEAALAIPFFVAALVAILFFIQVIQLQVRFQKALYHQLTNAAPYGYYYDSLDINLEEHIKKVITDTALRQAVISEVGEDYINSSYIVKGTSGIYVNLTGTASDEILDVALEYQVQPPFDLLGLGKLTLVSRAQCGNWIGRTNESGNQEDIVLVYVTSQGSVYHKNRDCTYIKVTYDSCKVQEISSKRNDSGGKYYPCEYCWKEDTKADKVYYMSYGTRYHSSPSRCPNFQRNVFAMELEEAQKQYRPCSKCGGS